MSFDVNWDVDKYREDHECEEHWELRKAFIERWKHEYSEERLICLARVFSNMEFMGCRYPTEVMQEVTRLSQEVAQSYRNSKKNKLQRTFVSASDAAEDRAKGTKREGGIVIDAPAPKSARIQFVKQGQDIPEVNKALDSHKQNVPEQESQTSKLKTNDSQNEARSSQMLDLNEYFKEMAQVRCLDVRSFDERMFFTGFGQLVLLIRPWASKWQNIQASCQVCNAPFTTTFENGVVSMFISDNLVARATGSSKAEAKSIVETMAWNRLRNEVISVVVKEAWIAQGSAITLDEVSRPRGDEFGGPVENSVATKMMKLMGWKGGGLGADAQGISEPIKPHLQMVNRQGLGSSAGVQGLRRAASALMRRYLSSDALDVDLVFSRDFSKEERAALHQLAQKMGLASRSYGANEDRFLVVKKKLDPFSLTRAVLEKGGNTPKYQVYIPCGVDTRSCR
ncbi:uncharacterized protein [Choristoneura fumiferana]|uniref:uncharacterized protein n=1 Tax=Choristoneura fumiferana TaxID=7141 RepID=UPI003D15619D